MKSEDAIRVQHRLSATQSAIQFMQGRSHAELADNQMRQFAVMKAIEIIGEAATRVSVAGQQEAPEIPWAVIKGIRNRLVHAYFDIDVSILYATVKDALPPSLKQLQGINLQE